MLLLTVAVMAYYLIYIWRYELVVQDFEIHIPTYQLHRKVYDLRKLELIEDDGAYSFHLWFEGENGVSILKYVEGRSILMKELTSRLEKNFINRTGYIHASARSNGKLI